MSKVKYQSPTKLIRETQLKILRDAYRFEAAMPKLRALKETIVRPTR